MLKRSLIFVAVIGLFGLIGFAVAQQQPKSQSAFQNPTGFQSNSLSPAISTKTPVEQKPAGGWLLRMTDGEVVGADLAEPFEVSLKTKFGDVSVDSDQIISLRIISPQRVANNTFEQTALPASPEKGNGLRDIVVATAAGDIISGKSNFEQLQLKLTWGTATANADSIDFICNRQFGVMTIVNDPASPSFMLSAIQLDRTMTRIVEQARAARVVTPGQLTLPTVTKQRPANMFE